MKSKNWIRLAAVTILILGQVTVVSADSIWARKGTSARELYADDVAARIGDILTINISEASNAKNVVERDLSNKTVKSATFDGDLDSLVPEVDPDTDVS